MKVFGVPIFEKISQVQVKSPTASFAGIQNNDGSLWSLVSQIRKVSHDRHIKIETYAQMAEDSTVSTALEMMAEDASQYDQGTGKCFWIESKDAKLSEELNNYIWNKLELDSRLYSWAYAIARDGELFLKTYRTEREALSKKKQQLESLSELAGPSPLQKSGPAPAPAPANATAVEDEMELLNVEDFYEEISDASSVLDLTRFGRTVGFYHKQGDNDGVLYPPGEFVHFCSDRVQNRFEIKIELPNPEDTKGQKITRVFKVKYGTSFIAGAVQSFNIMMLMEDIMVLSRISRSSLFRLFQVDVGGAGKLETVKILREVKNSLKARERIDIKSGSYKSDISAIPMNDQVFIPTRAGKGEIQVQTVGGDIDVKSIVDIDYFMSKFCGGLRIPKPFLGFDENLPGSIGNTSLTRMDIRYARTVKRIVIALRNGVKEICNMHLEDTGRSSLVGQFTVHSTHINDAEESDRVKDLGDKVEAASQLSGMVSSLPNATDNIDTIALLRFIFKDLMGLNADQFIKPSVPGAVVKPKDDAESLFAEDMMASQVGRLPDDGSTKRIRSIIAE